MKPVDGLYVDPAKEHRVRMTHLVFVCIKATL